MLRKSEDADLRQRLSRFRRGVGTRNSLPERFAQLAKQRSRRERRQVRRGSRLAVGGGPPRGKAVPRGGPLGAPRPPGPSPRKKSIGLGASTKADSPSPARAKQG